MEELQRQIYEAISKPACDRCQSRTDWHPTDCDKHDCHKLYAQETEAVLNIVFEQRVQGFSDALDEVVHRAEEIANNRTLRSDVRLFALDEADSLKSWKPLLLHCYEVRLEE